MCSAAIPALTLGLLWLGGLWLSSARPDLLEDIHTPNVDYQIVKAQMRRLTELTDGDIAILGDSSALMGIDPAILEKSLGRGVESYATLGYVGPQGYAHMLDLLAARPGSVRNVLLVFHPIQFHREQFMEVWIPLLHNWNTRQVASPTLAPLELARSLANRHLVYSPLPGTYAAYYGSPENFVRTIHENKGSAIDPGTGLRQRRLEDVENSPSQGYANIDLGILDITDLYRQSLEHLRESIASLGPEKVYLVLGPLPLGNDAQAQQRIIGSLREVAQRLGLPPAHVILPSRSFTLDNRYFSSTTHLNRHGKQAYTKALAQDLAFLGVRER